MSAQQSDSPGAADGKGKGRAVDTQQDVGMEEDDEESSDEESGAEEAVEEEADDDNMEEIDTDNIINDGRRTRGKSIDFAKAAQDNPEEDEDEEDDEDFEEPEDDEMQG